MNKTKDKTKQVLEAVARKTITAKEGANLLTESFTPTSGSTVSISHGIGAGSKGIFEGESNGGYAKVRTSAGLLQVPMIFVGPCTN